MLYCLWIVFQCSTCGPSHLQNGPDAFRCFGEHLCCSPTKGCIKENRYGSRICAYENMNMTPCENHVKSCSSVEHGGQCVTRGLCCNSKGIRYSKVFINNFVLVTKSIIYVLQAYVLKMLNAKIAKSLEKAILQPQAMKIRT